MIYIHVTSQILSMIVILHLRKDWAMMNFSLLPQSRGLRVRIILASIITGASVYHFTIGKTINMGPIHLDPSSQKTLFPPSAHPPNSDNQTGYDPLKHPLCHSPILAKLNPLHHILQSDKQTIEIKRSILSPHARKSLLTTVVHGIFHGYAFQPQRSLLVYLSKIKTASTEPTNFNTEGTTPPLVTSSHIADQPEDSLNHSECVGYWDLRPIKDITSLKPGTSLLNHFWIVDVSISSVTMLFGDPSPSSEHAGLLQINVDENVGRNKDKVEISMTTVMFNPKENRNVFSEWMWVAHIGYSRILLQNAAIWTCWPNCWSLLWSGP
jgi:hypothetical protein